jgi:hypothetical protein
MIEDREEYLVVDGCSGGWKSMLNLPMRKR